MDEPKKKRRRILRTISIRTHTAVVALDNAQSNPEIMSALSVYGYNDQKLSEGRSLYDETVALISTQKEEYGTQHKATENLNNANSATYRKYMQSLTIARIVFDGNIAAENALVLSGPREESLAGWLGQAIIFYDNLLKNPEYLQAIASRGCAEDKLIAERTLVKAVVRFDGVQEADKGKAVASTQVRNDKLKQLDRWMGEFKKIARIALKGNTEWLKAVGLMRTIN